MLHGMLEVSFMGEPSPGDARSRDANLGTFLEKLAKKRKTITCNSGVCLLKAGRLKQHRPIDPKSTAKLQLL